MRLILALAALSLLSACSPPIPQLPIAHSNNAVAIAEDANGRPTLYSFNGLRAGKTHTDVSKNVFACPINRECRQLDDVPVLEGRLASSAVTLNNMIYLFGGYTVAEDGSEVSAPETLMFDPVDKSWHTPPAMPTPVDDAVIFTHQERYIYLVSGWHNEGNVSLVQVYDVQDDRWFRATDYPGEPVFGHSGGAVGGKFIIADGVAVVDVIEGKRKFGAVDEVWLGEINEDNPAIIAWSKHPAHPGGPLYRMAAMGDAERGQILFAGGADNPYNIDGNGYDGTPAKPSDTIFAFDLATETWRDLGELPLATMDHRGLLKAPDGRYHILGGMDADLAVLDTVQSFTLELSTVEGAQ